MSHEMNQADLFNDAFMSIQEPPFQPSTDATGEEVHQWLSSHYGLELDAQLTDGGQRLTGVYPFQSYIVQAPAGSGKTSLLSQRFLAILSQVEAPEQILAMTFTKKAAAEMRERVVEALANAHKPLPDNAPLVDINSQRLAQKALQRDAEKQWQLLANPNRLRIKTIDGLNSFLVGQMPFLSKMGGSPKVVQDPTLLYQEAVRQLLRDSNVEASVGRLLRLVNGRFQRAENLLVSMLGKRDQWMRTLIQFQGDEARATLQLAISELVEKSLKDQASQLYFLSDSFIELCRLADYAAENGMDDVQCLSAMGSLSFDVDSIAQWRTLANWVLTATDSVRKRADKKIGFPAGKGANKEYKQRFEDVLETLSRATADKKVLDALVALKYLPEPSYDDQQWQDLQWLIQLLTMSVAHLKWVFQQHGQADYIEIAQAASIALGEEESPTDLAQQLDYQIQHLLVDEFQDTSSEQYRLLIQLVSGWQKGDGRSLFLVGDPMQSIYRFREAEVGNFLKAWQGTMGSVELKPLNLKVNFRSSQGVVDWVNQTFLKLFPTESDIEKGAVCYTSSEAFSDDNTPAIVPSWTLNGEAEQEAIQVVHIVQKRLQVFEQEQQACSRKGVDYKAKKIAILGRSRSSLTSIAQQLKRHRIGFRAVELEGLAERQEVQDMLALSRALLHLGDKPAWIALLRSPLVGLNLMDLTYLIGDKPFQSVWSSLSTFKSESGQFEQDNRLSAEGIKRLEIAIPILEKSLNQLGKINFAILIKETWLQLDGPLSVENSLALDNVEVFLQSLSESETPIHNLTQLEAQIDKLFARPDSALNSQSIELMTMHKSKGLEFDTVILPGLGRQPRGDDTELVSWFQFMNAQGQEQLVIAPIDQKGQSTSLLRTLLKRVENEKQQYELGRLLYVAVTRVKNKLYLFGDVKFKPSEKQLESGEIVVKAAKNSLLETLWDYVKPDFESLACAYEPVEKANCSDEAFIPPVCRLSLERTGFQSYQAQSTLEPIESVKPEIGLSGNDDIENQTSQDLKLGNQHDALLNTTVGNLVHAIFEQMVGDDLASWNTDEISKKLPIYERWLSQHGLPKDQMTLALERVKVSLCHSIANSNFVWAMQNTHKASACELALTSKSSDGIQNHIVDRTFVDDDGTRWIIDYKTSVFEGDEVEAFIDKQIQHYRPQLARYSKLFNQMESRAQKWVLYFSYLDRWVEIEPID